MTKWQLDRSGGPFDYPTLGFSAVDGAIIDGTLSNPELTTAPDAFWTEYLGASAETGVTRWGEFVHPPAPAEPTAGSMLLYDVTDNRWAPTTAADVVADPEFGAALSATIATETAPLADDVEDSYATPTLPRYRMRPPYLTQFRSAVDDVIAGTGPCKVLCIGDSTTGGVGGGSEATFAQANSYPAYLKVLLDGAVARTTHGLIVPPSLSGSILGDTRFVFTTPPNGWQWRPTDALYAYIGFGGKGANVRCSSGTNPLTLSDSRVVWDRADVYMVETDSGTGATYSMTATGGTAVTGTTASSPSKNIRKVTVSAATASASNTLSMVRTGGGADWTIVGVEFYHSTQHSIRIANAGLAGSDTTGWNAYPNANPALAWNSINCIKAYAPDLTIIDLGINDSSTPVAAATVAANIATLVTAAKVSGDVLIKTPIPGSGREATLRGYRDQLLLADDAMLDLLAHYDTHARMDAHGWKADTLHGTASGYQAVARAVAKGLFPESFA